MKRTLLALGCCLLLLPAGCRKSQPLDEPVDPAAAEAALRSALDAWQQGETYGSLESRDPPAYLNEREWEAGKKLLKYQLGPVELMGRQGRCAVTLTLQDKGGKVTERTITYLVDTTPRIVITREGLG